MKKLLITLLFFFSYGVNAGYSQDPQWQSYLHGMVNKIIPAYVDLLYTQDAVALESVSQQCWKDIPDPMRCVVVDLYTTLSLEGKTNEPYFSMEEMGKRTYPFLSERYGRENYEGILEDILYNLAPYKYNDIPNK